MQTVLLGQETEIKLSHYFELFLSECDVFQGTQFREQPEELFARLWWTSGFCGHPAICAMWEGH